MFERRRGLSSDWGVSGWAGESQGRLVAEKCPGCGFPGCSISGMTTTQLDSGYGVNLDQHLGEPQLKNLPILGVKEKFGSK